MADDSKLLYSFPFLGMPYEYLETGQIKQSGRGAAFHYLAASAGRRSIHAWLGSAGNMMPSQHYVRIIHDAFRGPTSPFQKATPTKMVGSGSVALAATTPISTFLFMGYASLLLRGLLPQQDQAFAAV